MTGQIVIEQHVEDDSRHPSVASAEQLTQLDKSRMLIREAVNTTVTPNTIDDARMELGGGQRPLHQITGQIANDAVRVGL